MPRVVRRRIGRRGRQAAPVRRRRLAAGHAQQAAARRPALPAGQPARRPPPRDGGRAHVGARRQAVPALAAAKAAAAVRAAHRAAAHVAAARRAHHVQAAHVRAGPRAAQRPGPTHGATVAGDARGAPAAGRAAGAGRRPAHALRAGRAAAAAAAAARALAVAAAGVHAGLRPVRGRLRRVRQALDVARADHLPVALLPRALRLLRARERDVREAGALHAAAAAALRPHLQPHAVRRQAVACARARATRASAAARARTGTGTRAIPPVEPSGHVRSAAADHGRNVCCCVPLQGALRTAGRPTGSGQPGELPVGMGVGLAAPLKNSVTSASVALYGRPRRRRVAPSGAPSGVPRLQQETQDAGTMHQRH